MRFDKVKSLKTAGKVTVSKTNDEFVVTQKMYDSETGEEISPRERTYSQTELEREKAQLEAEIERIQTQIDGIDSILNS